MPTLIPAYLCTTPPPYEGLFQPNPIYRLMILSPVNKKRYLIFSSLTTDLFSPIPSNRQKTPVPINNNPFLLDLFTS